MNRELQLDERSFSSFFFLLSAHHSQTDGWLVMIVWTSVCAIAMGRMNRVLQLYVHGMPRKRDTGHDLTDGCAIAYWPMMCMIVETATDQPNEVLSYGWIWSVDECCGSLCSSMEETSSQPGLRIGFLVSCLAVSCTP